MNYDGLIILGMGIILILILWLSNREAKKLGINKK